MADSNKGPSNPPSNASKDKEDEEPNSKAPSNAGTEPPGADEGEQLVAAALEAGEWKEERSKTSKGDVKIWYWLRKDKKVKMKNRAALAQYLLQQKLLSPPDDAPGAADGDRKDGVDDTAVASKPSLPTPAAHVNPDLTKLASMGVLGTDVDAMSDVTELRNQIKLWEAKYKVLLDENKRLLIGSGILAPPVAGVTVPSDLQLKFDALLRQNQALQAELEVKGLEVERLGHTVEDLTDHKAKLETQLGEAFQKAAEGMEYKLKLQQRDDVVQKASGFVNDHFREQNKFLSAQVAELTALLNKIKEEDHVAAKVAAAEAPLVTEDALTPAERAKVAVHFQAIVNTPARHVLCGRCRATLARMITSEGGDQNLSHAIMSANVQPHADTAPAALPRPAYIHKAVPTGLQAQPVHVIQARPTHAPQQPAAVAQFEGYIVRTRQ
eukprot:TRINITY_DN14550_c0_g1_i1.p1 TRINITY_DN14550_c0_g1~~TRINITY_DN14550_c0_g1_i1.p1  ORF type:complete len:439 (+),score=170.68 TRINITY_DN14550_c0_g1_i1:57-1373(+)